jgi:hypothetical protein
VTTAVSDYGDVEGMSEHVTAGVINMSETSRKMVKSIGLAAAGLVAAGGLLLGTASLASASSSTPAASTSAAAASSSSSSSGSAGGNRGASSDTPVTGDELAKVTAAMKAQDATITITSVRKDPDGSYDVLGTKDGSNVMFDVSSDLKTFTQNTGGAGKGHGSR